MKRFLLMIIQSLYSFLSMDCNVVLFGGVFKSTLRSGWYLAFHVWFILFKGVSCSRECLVKGSVMFKGVSCSRECHVQGSVMFKGVSCSRECHVQGSVMLHFLFGQALFNYALDFSNNLSLFVSL